MTRLDGPTGRIAVAHDSGPVTFELSGQMRDMRRDLAKHVLDLDMGFHKEHTPGELIERIDGDVTALSNLITYAISRERLLALVEKSPTAREGMLDYIRRSYED